VPTSKGEEREWENGTKGWEEGREEGEGREGKGREGRTHVPDWESAKVATLFLIRYDTDEIN